MKRFRFAFLAATCVLAVLTAQRAAAAQQAFASGTSAAPAPPAMVTRTAAGDATIRAVRIDRPMRIDGQLNEEIYATVPAVGGFIEQEPHEGEPAGEPTDIWILFDDKNLYISARCWDSHPEREVVTELRRDGMNITNNEHLVVILDTLHDKRNGFYFQTTPLGAMRDQAITDDEANDSWNTVWDVKAGRFEHGWTMEMTIPFKSLRYRTSGPQVWGINFRRKVQWKNEVSNLVPVAAQYGMKGVHRMALAATLVGIETPGRSRNLEVKPYTVSSVTTDRTTAVPVNNVFKQNVGFDFKYGLTRSLIADATVNTDFAQVEEDLQQVNLTRFSLFFPEKRDFFLEGQGIFAFGGVAATSRGTPGDVPVLFFSRRIGLSQGQSVPVVGGGRVAGKAGRFGLGVLNVQTDDKVEAAAVATNFTVARVKWDFLRRSNIGFIATRRSPTIGNGGANLAVGADANLLLFRSVTINSYYAQTQTPGITEGNTSYRGKFEYATDRYGLVAEHLTVGDHFTPEIGYVRRTDFRRNFGEVRFSPRPKRSKLIRKLEWQGSLDYLTDAHQTAVQNREVQGSFQIHFQNSDQFSLEYTDGYELLPRNFNIAPRVVVPAGGYNSETTRVSYMLGQQRMFSGRLSAAKGTFYGGTKSEGSYSGRLALTPRFSVEPSVSLNWVALPYGNFTAPLVNSRFIVTPTAHTLVGGLVQYNASTHTLSSSMRFHWEYTSGSDLFVVYSDGRDTSIPGAPAVLNRSVAVKVTRLSRF